MAGNHDSFVFVLFATVSRQVGCHQRMVIHPRYLNIILRSSQYGGQIFEWHAFSSKYNWVDNHIYTCCFAVRPLQAIIYNNNQPASSSFDQHFAKNYHRDFKHQAVSTIIFNIFQPSRIKIHQFHHDFHHNHKHPSTGDTSVPCSTWSSYS